MNTVSFLQSLNDSADKCGLLNADGTIAATHAAFLARAMETRCRQAWRFYEWPELTRSEERAYRPLFALADTYILGDEVYDEESDAYYVAQQDAFSGHPVADQDYWLPVDATFERYVALDQAGFDSIGEILGASVKNPAIAREPRNLLYTLGSNGIGFAKGSPTTVWLHYRLPSPKLTSQVWTAGLYAAKSVRYHVPTGECYRALRSTSSPPTNDADWQLQAIPERFHDFIVAALFADFLRDDGQEDKAVTAEDDAMQILEEERNQFTKQQGQGARYKVRVR